MEIRAVEGFMIKPVLVAGFLLSGLPVGSGADQLPVSVIRIAIDDASNDGDGWRTDALKPLDLEINGNGPESPRSIAVSIERGALLGELPMLQEHGVLSNNITKEEVARQPASYTNVLSLLLTSYAVRNLYKAHSEFGRISWNVSDPVLEVTERSVACDLDGRRDGP